MTGPDHGFVESGDGGFYGTIWNFETTRSGGQPPRKENLVKYDRDGAVVWSVPCGGEQASFGMGAALDPRGFFYARGFITKPRGRGGQDLVLAKFATFSPSFDCAKAAIPQEELICASRTLSELDKTIAQLYRASLDKSPDPSAVRADQSEWVKDERNFRTTAEELEASMKARVAQLKKRLTAP
jgi:hypothetical protein